MSLFPIVINNRNRLTSTRKMVEHLLVLSPDQKIIIIDNGSTYPPLLEWYKTINNTVDVQMNKNEGHLALWVNRLHTNLPEYFIYTDSDLELNPMMPYDYQETMYKIMCRHSMDKVALAIRIDDLPTHYRYINQVIRNESGWWKNELEKDVYLADTDTTFSLMKNTGSNMYRSARIAKSDFVCRHLPWYSDLKNLDEEEIFYLEHHDNHFMTQYTLQHKNPENFNDV